MKVVRQYFPAATHVGLGLFSRFSKLAICLVALALSIFAQAGSGDISASLTQYSTLGQTILTTILVVAAIAFVALLIWGGLTLTTNRPRGLAMILGGLCGALLMGVAIALVTTLSGQNVTAGAGAG